MSTFSTSGKLIVVSNRLPFVLSKNPKSKKWERKASAGGLVTAVAPVVVQGNGLWIGWPGVHLERDEIIPESDPNDRTPTSGLRSENIIAVRFDPETFDNYYNGCCNRTFWPLFHSMADRAQFCAEAWKSYCVINKEFASKTINALENLSKEDKHFGTPLVWLHDYHLMLAANTIRNVAFEKNMKFKLGFFLHIPFPPWDIFRLFPWANEILQGMLGCDMIGFHIEDYCLNFMDCCQRRLGCFVDRNTFVVKYGGRIIRIHHMPIGIPFDGFVEMAEQASSVISTSLQLILSVDRLDYTKGLVHRLKAFELLLERYPQHRSKVSFMQIAVPSRTNIKEYRDLKEEIDQLVGRINGRFTTPNWSPIKYIYGCVSQNILAAFYRDSAVAMVTPLRDGMNLVAKEFVACQIREVPGVLILSPFAGAGEVMHEALICNPYELVEAANTLHRALTMAEDERILRMNCLRQREREYDVDYWMRSFLKKMDTLILEDGNVVMPTIKREDTIQDFDDYLSKYIGNANKLALLLDYDGTLAPLAIDPDLAILPWETKNVLERLAYLPGIHISIISGRNVHNLKNMVGIEGLTYAGNHGLEIIYPDSSYFVQTIPEEYEKQINVLSKVLHNQVCKYGAWIEYNSSVLIYHYALIPADARPKFVSMAQKLIEEAGLKPVHSHFTIEVKPMEKWNKGSTSLFILRTYFNMNCDERIPIIYAGDDATDEYAIQALKGMALTFRITKSEKIKTSAEHCLLSTDSVLTMLKWIEHHFKKYFYLKDSDDDINNIIQLPLSKIK